MNIDQFDKDFLGESGNSQDILKQTIGVDASLNNANKYLTGVRHYLNYKLKNAKRSAPIEEMEEVILKADGSQTTKRMLRLSEEDKKNPARIMELMGYDPLQWEMISCKTRRNYWDVTMKLGEGGGSYPHKETNHAFECTVTVKPLQNKLSTVQILEVFDRVKLPKVESYTYKAGTGFLLELPIMDVHVGKLAWGSETGETNYDLKIASELYKNAILDILTKIKSARWPVEKIIFPVGQDFFHIDTIDNTTTRGTHVDTDGRWVKIYQDGVYLLVWAVEQLRKIAPVEIMYVAGNHDKMMSYFATMHLGAQYRDCKGVNVDVSPTKRKYIRWGKCLIGYSHGKMEGKRIQTLMQEESPDWSDCKFREWHLGDLHHEESNEIGGVIIRRISALTATDAWHNEMGYKGSIRKAQAFLWDKEKGRQFVVDSNVVE